MGGPFPVKARRRALGYCWPATADGLNGDERMHAVDVKLSFNQLHDGTLVGGYWRMAIFTRVLVP